MNTVNNHIIIQDKAAVSRSQNLRNGGFVFIKTIKSDGPNSYIVSLGNITKDTLVIEIGVGAAALTKKISEKAFIANTSKEAMRKYIIPLFQIKMFF